MNATAVAVLPTIAQLPYTETDLYHGGELQISPDGKQLLWYHLGQRAAFFDYQNIKPYSFILGDNMAGVVQNPAGTAIIPEFIDDLLIPTANPLLSAFTLKTNASIDIDKIENENNIYFTQKTINNIDNLYKNSILQTGTTNGGDVRRGKGGNVAQALNTALLNIGTGLPVQVHTITDMPLSAPTRVQASRLLRVRNFELKDHLGNVRVIVSDQKDANADAQVQSYYNYYAFGMEMPNRTFDADKAYRYGFNGKENDKDFGTAGLTQDYGFRLYNPAIAKFLSVDPLFKSYAELTPYQFASNTPIWATDLDGLEADYWGIRLYLWFCEPMLKVQSGVNNIVHAETERNNSDNQGYISNVPDGIKDARYLSQTAIGVGEVTQGIGEGIQRTSDVMMAAAPTPGFGKANGVIAFADGVVCDVVISAKRMNWFKRVNYDVKKFFTQLFNKKNTKVGEEIVEKDTKEISPAVQKVLDIIEDFKNQGDVTIKKNKLNGRGSENNNQEINYTFQQGSEKLDIRIETHVVPEKFGGNGKTPQRHLNVDLGSNKKALPKNGHKVLE